MNKIRNIFLIIMAFCVSSVIFVNLGRYQSKEWSETNRHYQMESLGYNYCPYCGKELKGESDD